MGRHDNWKYDTSPYLEEGSQLYVDMKTAYDAGANYVVVFNDPQVGDYGVLTQEHLDAFKDFRAYASNHPQQKVQRTAYVLPEDYGFGFRNPNDSIWGVWKADETAPKIWNQTQHLESIYGDNLDIIYDSLWTRVFWSQHYNHAIWWNAITT